MCCGQKRLSVTLNSPVEYAGVKLLYKGNGSAQIRGAATGQVYQFPRQSPAQDVDPRDVPALIRTRMFTQVR